jgi:hypothetical protein
VKSENAGPIESIHFESVVLSQGNPDTERRHRHTRAEARHLGCLYELDDWSVGVDPHLRSHEYGLQGQRDVLPENWFRGSEGLDKFRTEVFLILRD